MNIRYIKLLGYGLGIQFHGISRELRDEVVKFVNYNVECRNASHHEAARRATPFLQRDGFRSSTNGDEKATCSLSSGVLRSDIVRRFLRACESSQAVPPSPLPPRDPRPALPVK